VKTLFDWLTNRDRSHSPDRAFTRALRQRQRRLDQADEVITKTRQARARIELDIFERRAEIARTHDRARIAAQAGDDRAALKLLEHKQTLHENLNLAEQELRDLTSDLTTAEQQLERLQAETRELHREKRQLDARLTAAQAREGLQNFGAAASKSAADRALSSARQRVEALAAHRELEAELSHDELEDLATEPARQRAHMELTRLKSKRGRLTAV
jgi:phage shock protein A